MGITLNRITTVARFVLLPALLILALTMSWLPSAASSPLLSQFGLGYATLVVMLIAFRRRSAAGLALVAGIVLVTASAAGPADGGVSRMIGTIAGVVCGMAPACLREWQRLAGEDLHMNLFQLRLLSRRRKQGMASFRSGQTRRGHLLMLPAPRPGYGDERVGDAFGSSDVGQRHADVV